MQMTEKEIITAARDLSRQYQRLLPFRRNAETSARSWLRSQTLRQKALLTTALALGVGLTVTLANQIGLDQQAAAGFYLAAITLLSGQCFPSSDGMPDVAEMQGKQQPTQHKQPTSAFGCRLALPVDTSDVLIDHTGQIIPASELPGHLGYPNPDFDLAAYAVKQIGMIHVTCTAVRLVPRLTSPRAIEIAGYLLTLRGLAGPMRVSTYEAGAWHLTTCRTPLDAAMMVERITDRGDATPRFAAAPSGVYTLPAPMRDVFQAWRESGGELAEGAVQRLRSLGAWDRTIALRPVDGDGFGFAFLHIGRGITAFGNGWRERMIGKVDDGRPDPAYAAAVSDLYRQSLGADLPAVNRVRATLNVERQPEPVRLNYRQMLLPWRFHDGRRWTSVLTSITERLQPPEPHHAAA